DLIQRINKKNVPVSGVTDARNGESAGSPAVPAGELLEELVMRRLAKVLARKDPLQGEIAEKVVEKMLSEGWPDEGLDSTRTRVKELLENFVSSQGSRQDGKAADSGSPEEQE
ncbi:MAG: hypothetical protein VYB15_08635, partial [Planctomycetota bacterium]|nr:hypothetical protein [Planctomycetota bacterium]